MSQSMKRRIQNAYIFVSLLCACAQAETSLPPTHIEQIDLSPVELESELYPASGLLAEDANTSEVSKPQDAQALPSGSSGEPLSDSTSATPDSPASKSPSTVSASPSAVMRRTPAPAIDSPPFPSGEWQIGGTPVIGAPDTSSNDYLLMKTLRKTELGQFMDKNRIKLYGWVNVGGTAGTSKKSNYPVTYPVYSRRVDLDQLAITLERIPDTVQREHIDWGFRVTSFYGIDYRLTTMKGIMSNQLLKYNREYGFDPVLFYGDVYIPQIAKGMNIRFGRYLSVPDIEAQLSPDNYMYTHSLLYGVDPYTQMGIVTTTKLNDRFNIQLGINGGNDVALWAGNRKNVVKPTGMVMLQWISKKNKDSLYFGMNAFNNGKAGYNNVQQVVGTWSHVFTPRLHTKTEAYYMYQYKVPKIGFAPEWAMVNYLAYKLNSKSYLTLRNEYYDDIKGQRYGVKNNMSSHALGLAYWFTPSIALRPEIRYDQAYNNPTFDYHTKKHQVLFAMDLIYRF